MEELGDAQMLYRRFYLKSTIANSNIYCPGSAALHSQEILHHLNSEEKVDNKALLHSLHNE